MAPKIESTSALTKVFSVASYLYFFTVLLFLFAFLVPQEMLPEEVFSIIPGTLDGAPVNANAFVAIATDLALLSLFSVLHIVLARPTVKKAMGIPTGAERSFFVLQAAICLHATFMYWQNFDLGGPLYDLGSDKSSSLYMMGLYAVGCLTLVSATFALDHFHLFGLTQGLGLDINGMLGLAPKISEDDSSCVVVRWHYKLVAHPIMSGFFIMFWSTPVMTLPRLLFASAMSLFIYIAVVHFEEPGMVSDCGAAYKMYLKNTPRFFPGVKSE